MTAIRTLLLALLAWGPSAIRAQQSSDLLSRFQRQEVMIPARDGVRLHTLIFAPRESHGALPFILTRTPYGAGNGAGERSIVGSYAEMARDGDGYIFVFQDVRGKFRSEGEFVVMRPPALPDAGSSGSSRADSRMLPIPLRLGPYPVVHSPAGRISTS